MVYFRRFTFLMCSKNLLCTRNCLLNLYQNASKSALRQLKETIFPIKPKKPEAPFLLYVRNVKSRFVEESPNIKYAEILKKASREWAKLDLTEKTYFLNQYYKNREIYMDKLNEYNNSITNEQRQLWKEKEEEYKRSNSDMNNKRKYEILGKPKRPPNAYLCYLASKKHDKDPNMNSKEWVKLLSTRWKELSDAEKNLYNNEFNQLWTQYCKDLENWEVEMIHSGHFDVVRPKILMKYNVIKKEME